MESKKRNGREDYVAAIFGVTGLIGKELARQMTSSSSSSRWKKVYGIARSPELTALFDDLAVTGKFEFIECDLQNPKEVREKLTARMDHVTHVFWVTWASQSPYYSPACRDDNKAMICNALDVVVRPNKAVALKHFSLQTGLKHYVSLLGPCSDGIYDEDCPRVVSDAGNFYYDLEDLIEERLKEIGGHQTWWSVHRPGLLIGNSRKSYYNFIGTLCVYASIRRHLALPFVFGGTTKCWDNFYLDGSDARLVAAQHVWAATCQNSPTNSSPEAFNAVNGVEFSWREIWPEVARELGFGPGEAVFSEEFRFSEAMEGKGWVWDEIVERQGLVRTKIEELANWEFMDVLFRCPMKLLGKRDKVDRLGFDVRYHVLDSILYWIRSMRNDNLIP